MLNKVCMSRKRALESDSEALCRREMIRLVKLTMKHYVEENQIDWQRSENVCVKLILKHCVEEKEIN